VRNGAWNESGFRRSRCSSVGRATGLRLDFVPSRSYQIRDVEGGAMSKVTRLGASVGADEVAIRSIAPPQGTPHLGSVLVPPLIGGSGLQQFGYFRSLNERGYRLFTFDYRGHGRSGGRFRVRNTIQDAHAVLRAVRAELDGGPLFGVADCYGCIPLLCAAAREPGAFRALALFNPIPSLQHIAPPAAVLAEYFAPRDASGKRRLAWRDPLDLRGMVLATTRRLFAHVDQSRAHFGILRYARAHTWLAAWEYLRKQPLASVVSDAQAEVWFGRSDRLLRLVEPEAEARYRALWRTHLPNAEVRVLEDADHFWTGVRARASAVAAALFERVAPVPAEPAGACYREPGEAPGWNHQLGGLTTSSGLKHFVAR